MKYYCINCEQMFDEEELISEVDQTYYGSELEIAVCPCCRDNYCIEEAVECDVCGEYYAESKTTELDTNEHICDGCYKKIQDKLNEYLRTLTDIEKEVLSEVLYED